MPSAGDIVETICSALRSKQPASLPFARVREWLGHDDPEVRGAAYKVLSEEPHVLDPHPTVDDFVSLALEFLDRTIGAASGGDWAYSGYETAWNLASWFNCLALDPSTPRPLVDSIVGRLGALYERLDENSRETLVNGALEHIFERQELRDLFSGWTSHPVLARAYADSCLWGDKGGDSPLVGRGQRGPTQRHPGGNDDRSRR